MLVGESALAPYEPGQGGGSDPLVGYVQHLQVERVHVPAPQDAPRQRAVVGVIVARGREGTHVPHRGQRRNTVTNLASPSGAPGLDRCRRATIVPGWPGSHRPMLRWSPLS